MTDGMLQTVLAVMRKFAPSSADYKWVDGKKVKKRPSQNPGNLRNNATNAEFINPSTISVYVDADIAPYAVYTNEPWVHPRWHGKQNPNEGWVLRGADAIAQTLADELGGELQ